MESQIFNRWYATVTSSSQRKPERSKQMFDWSEQILAAVLWKTLPSPWWSENLDDEGTGNWSVGIMIHLKKKSHGFESPHTETPKVTMLILQLLFSGQNLSPVLSRDWGTSLDPKTPDWHMLLLPMLIAGQASSSLSHRGRHICWAA